MTHTMAGSLYITAKTVFTQIKVGLKFITVFVESIVPNATCVLVTFAENENQKRVVVVTMMITKTTKMPTGIFAWVVMRGTVPEANRSGNEQIMRGAEMVVFQEHKFEWRVVAKKFPKFSESHGDDNDDPVLLLLVWVFGV